MRKTPTLRLRSQQLWRYCDVRRCRVGGPEGANRGISGGDRGSATARGHQAGLNMHGAGSRPTAIIPVSTGRSVRMAPWCRTSGLRAQSRCVTAIASSWARSPSSIASRTRVLPRKRCSGRVRKSGPQTPELRQGYSSRRSPQQDEWRGEEQAIRSNQTPMSGTFTVSLLCRCRLEETA